MRSPRTILSHLLTFRLSSAFMAFFISRLGSLSPHSMAPQLCLGGSRYSSSEESSAAGPLSAPVAPRVSFPAFAIAPGLFVVASDALSSRCWPYVSRAHRQQLEPLAALGGVRPSTTTPTPTPNSSPGPLCCPERRPPLLASEHRRLPPPRGGLCARRVAGSAGSRCGCDAVSVSFPRRARRPGPTVVAVWCGEVRARPQLQLGRRLDAAAHGRPADPASVRRSAVDRGEHSL